MRKIRICVSPASFLEHMSMITLTPKAARSNLSNLLRQALQGEDIGIIVDGKIVALRSVAVESTDYPMREYGVTAEQLDKFEKRTHAKIKKARQ
jgi:antitoxin (DNA-binding transcriptional repressor) of toxin-antitoxin stability system